MRMNKGIFKRNDGFYDVKALAGETIFYVYDEIGKDNIRADKLVQDIAKENGPITIRVHSPGGNAFDGLLIYNAILRREHKTKIRIDGLAASAAAVFAMAGDEIEMPEEAFIMIHNAWGGRIGSAKEFRAFADTLEKLDQQLVGIFTKKTGKSESVIRKALEDTSWFNGKEALEWGFIDKISDAQPAKNSYDLSVFNNVPAILLDGISDGDGDRRDVDQEPEATDCIKSIINQIRS